MDIEQAVKDIDFEQTRQNSCPVQRLQRGLNKVRGVFIRDTTPSIGVYGRIANIDHIREISENLVCGLPKLHLFKENPYNSTLYNA